MDWNPATVSVKKEPVSTPCQVAEVTTSVSPVVKVEVTSPTQKGADVQQVVPPMMQPNGKLLLYYLLGISVGLVFGLWGGFLGLLAYMVMD